MKIKKPSRIVGTSQVTSWWNHLGGVWILPKRWGVVPITLVDILEGNASLGDVAFRF
jgi:hypothetical protein